MAKPTGFGVLVGFVLAVFLENLSCRFNKNYLKQTLVFILTIFLIIAPYFSWNLVTHQQLYLTTHHDRSLSYIPNNLPSLLTTIPLYLGIEFLPGLKSLLVSFMLFIFFGYGVITAVKKRLLTLIFPTLITLLMISYLSSCLIGWPIPGNYEFVTILGFAMIPASILLLLGLYQLTNQIFYLIFKTPAPKIVVTVLYLLLTYKLLNNYLTARYTLEYIPDNYYLSLPTVIKNRSILPQFQFRMENNTVFLIKRVKCRYNMFHIFRHI